MSASLCTQFLSVKILNYEIGSPSKWFRFEEPHIFSSVLNSAHFRNLISWLEIKFLGLFCDVIVSIEIETNIHELAGRNFFVFSKK